MSKFGVAVNSKSTTGTGNAAESSVDPPSAGGSTSGKGMTIDIQPGAAGAASCNGDGESTPSHDSLPTSPGAADAGRGNIAIDYMKARYESGKSKEPPALTNVPKVLREPRKLDVQWDKIVDDNAKKEIGVPVGFKEQDLLQMVFMCMGVDTKSNYLTAAAAPQPTTKDERQMAEIEALPEITKSVRNMFESGEITQRSTDASKKDRVYEALPEWGVYESKPTAQLEGIVRSADHGVEGDEIQRGMTSSLLSQWTRIGMDDPAKSQSPTAGGPFRPIYDFAYEGSGIFENEPVMIDGVVRSADKQREERIQRGLTKSLLGQWNSIGQDDDGRSKDGGAPPVRKSTYESVPGSGVFENEPVKIEGVVRASDVPAEGEQVQRGFTRSLLSQWQNKGTEQPKTPTKRIIKILEDEGTVSENEPIRRDDVVRADDNADEGEQVVRRGMAKALASEWKTKGSEGYRAERKSIILAEAEGTVSENEPVRRSDVVREDDPNINESEQVQRGTTKMLLNQWKCMGSSQSSKEKTPIVIAEADGRVVENEPVRRADIAREDDSGYGELPPVQRGMTKNLLQQWKTMGTDDGVWKERTPIVLEEAEGKVLESEPIRRTDVVHADEYIEDRGQVQRGMTKSLLSQWKTKGTEEFRAEKKPIVLDEGEGKVAENEPEVRTDVVRADDSLGAEQIKRGTTKSLMSQWKNKATEEFKVEKKPIVLAEAEDCVCENEPEVRTDVVRSEDADFELNPVQRGTTKSLLSQWKNKSSEEFRIEKKPIVLAEAEGKVLESEPVRRSDVVHADDIVDVESEQIKRGITRNLRQEWMKKGTEEFRKEKTPIVIAEGEGTIAESEPVRRDDVVHADDYEDETRKITRGSTKNRRQEWMKKGTEEFKKEKTPIVLAEAEGKILENEPVRRDDVVHSDDVNTEGEFVQRGMAQSLLSHWSNPNLQATRTERKSIILAEDEGRIAESEPVVRSDVVHADDMNSAESVVVQRGTTKSLLSQWKTKGTEEFRVERKAIIVAEGEGKVSENEPTVRTDVVRSGDVLEEGQQIKRGMAKSLASEWKQKGQEEFHMEKKAIIVAEGEGTVAENEPTVRTDVVRSVDVLDEGEQIKRGMAKSLASEWKQKGQEEFHMEKKAIIVAEGEGTVSENEPTIRTDIVRSVDVLDEGEQIKRGMAKSLASEWKQKGQEEFHVERKPIIVAEGEGKILESEPVRRDDVVHADDVLSEGETIRRGTTKSLLSQWKTKGTEEYKPQRKSIIIEDAEGKVAENEPEQRTDVVRENDSMNMAAELPTRGQAKQLRAQWMSKNVDDAAASKEPPKLVPLYDGDISSASFVVENNPQPRRTDVVREEDNTEEEITLKSGYARDLAGFWTAPRSEVTVSRERLDLAALREGSVGVVSENEPQRLEGVVRADDPAEEELCIERGLARNLASQWQNRRDDVERQPFRMDADINPNEIGVYENEPVELTDVVRCSEPVFDVVGQRGQIRNITAKYASAVSADEVGTPKRPPEQIVIDLADGPSVLENEPTPVDPSVVRSTWSEADETAGLRGIAHNMLQRWTSQQDLEAAAADRSAKPAWMVEMEMTPAGSGVFENSPVVRTDVIREEDREPEMIPIRQTRRTRAMWSRLERDEGINYVDPKVPELIRFTPPRELTPPPVGQEPYKSVQSVTLQSTQVLPITSGRKPPAPSPAHRHHDQPPRRPSQPSTPAGSSASSQFTWIPSANETARTRAQIGSEVLKWHAQRSNSRSMSFDEGSGSAGPQSPISSGDASEWVYQSVLRGTEAQDFGPASDATDPAAAAELSSSPSPQQPTTMKSSAVLVFKTSSQN